MLEDHKRTGAYYQAVLSNKRQFQGKVGRGRKIEQVAVQHSLSGAGVATGAPGGPGPTLFLSSLSTWLPDAGYMVSMSCDVGTNSGILPICPADCNSLASHGYLLLFTSLHHSPPLLSPPRPQVVLDVGTGSGILAIFAAKAGAKKVYAVEATNMAKNARKLVEHNKVRVGGRRGGGGEAGASRKAAKGNRNKLAWEERG